MNLIDAIRQTLQEHQEQEPYQLGAWERFEQHRRRKQRRRWLVTLSSVAALLAIAALPLLLTIDRDVTTPEPIGMQLYSAPGSEEASGGGERAAGMRGESGMDRGSVADSGVLPGADATEGRSPDLLGDSGALPDSDGAEDRRGVEDRRGIEDRRGTEDRSPTRTHDSAVADDGDTRNTAESTEPALAGTVSPHSGDEDTDKGDDTNRDTVSSRAEPVFAAAAEGDRSSEPERTPSVEDAGRGDGAPGTTLARRELDVSGATIGGSSLYSATRNSLGDSAGGWRWGKNRKGSAVMAQRSVQPGQPEGSARRVQPTEKDPADPASSEMLVQRSERDDAMPVVTDVVPKHRQSEQGVTFGIAYSPLLNFSGSTADWNIGGGVSVAWQFHENLALTSGLFLAQNQLEYQSGSGIGTMAEFGGGRIEEMTMQVDLLNLEIPVQLQVSLNDRFFVSAGVASGTFLRETYNYDFSYRTEFMQVVMENGEARTLHREVTLSESARQTEASMKRFNPLSSWNLSVGYQLSIGGDRNVSFEPFVKLPAGSPSIEDISYTTAGLLFRLGL